MRAVSSGPQSARVSAPPPALEELDRRLRWRFVPLLIFLAMMLGLARRRFEHAARGYRRALLLAPYYGEARLGLGMALALDAEREVNPLEQRSLRLQAIAQFAAVPEYDPVHAHALYDRTLLLAVVGRRAEAERKARDYMRLDGQSAWAESLGARLGAER